MRSTAVAFALALGASSPAIGATSVTEWDDEQFVVALTELMASKVECDLYAELKLEKFRALARVALDRTGVEIYNSSATEQRYSEITEALEEALEKPATFCWTIMEKYGPEGTVLPGMVRGR